MAVDRRDANLQKLNETAQVQNDTKEAIWRIQRQTAEAEQLGNQTLDELRRQGQQMDDIDHELDSVNSKLDHSQALQTRFDRWAGNWLGGKKARAKKEAAAEILERNREQHSQVKEVFQHEKFDSISRSWKKSGLVLCTDTSIGCDDLFDPALAESMQNSRWQIDFSLAGIDAEGWTYANKFSALDKTGAGDSAPKWNSYARRRKWRFIEQKATGSAALDEVHERNEARKAKASSTAAAKQAERVGYIPRNRQPTNLEASGLTSAGMISGRQQQEQLDDESAAGLSRLKETDKEIDQGIEQISASIDRLGNIAGQMKDETLVQNAKLEKIDANMNRTQEKQTVVNARQRYLLK